MSCSLHLMKTFFVFAAFFIFCSAQEIEIWEATNLRAVTYFEGIDEYYSDLRREQSRHNPPTEPKEPKERVLVKQRICNRIFTSHFFRMHQIVWVDTNFEQVRETLRTDHREAFYTIFDEYQYDIPGCLPLGATAGYGYDYRNLYRVRRVRVRDNEEGDEYVFSCVASDRASETLKVYFISQPYNVNLIGWSYPIAGRFIFSGDEPSTMVAMAEDSALESWFVRKSKLATFDYASHRWMEGLLFTPSELDPVCSLTPAQKLRLCTGLFSMSAFRKKVKFLPIIDSVLLGCERKTVSVPFTRTGLFQEWVIGCKALNEMNEEIVHYVSRGNEANAVYVFRDDGHQRLSVYNFCNNVSVVRELSEAATDVANNALVQIAAAVEAFEAEPAVERFLQENVED